jgi:hypothetical protein
MSYATDHRALDAIDALLRETLADPMALTWALDRPLLPSEARAVLARHRASPGAVQPGRSRETLHAAEDQLRMQARSFVLVAAALAAGDPALVPAGNAMGSGCDEVREILTDAAELRALLPEGAAERAALDAEHGALAAAFLAAADACQSCAVELQRQRHAIHQLDYAEVLVRALAEEEDEGGRREKNAGKPVEGARA